MLSCSIMEQHPVPQPISSYEFRLIGSMTLKQFAKLAAGILVALFFYALPLPAFLKWPAVGLFAFLGVGMAFLPINDRPMDVWITAFIKAIYSPTQYLWQKQKETLSSPVATPPPVKMSVSAVNQPISKPILNTQQAPAISHPAVNQPTNPTVINPTGAAPIDKEKQFLENLQATYTSTLAARPKIKIETVVENKTEPVLAKTAPINAFPFAPTQPNVICGLIKTAEGNLVDGAILDIKDQNGFVVRALKTSKLGQFRTATPLPNGTYELSIEKEGLNFDIIKLDLNGAIITPIEINPK